MDDSAVLFKILPVYLWVGFLLLVSIAVVAGFVFFFHWRNYGFQGRYVVLAESVFMVVTGTLLCSALFSVITFSVNI